MRARPATLAALLTLLTASGLATASTAPPASAPVTSAPATSAPASSSNASTDDDFADVAVKPSQAKGETKSDTKGHPAAPATGLGQLVGRLHPLLVHLPIGWLLLLCLVELVALRRAAGPGWQQLGRGLLVATLLVALPAVVSGLLRADALPADPATTQHRNVMLALVALLVVALPLRLGGGVKPPLWRRLGYLVLLVGAVFFLLWGSHLGSVLVRGPNYLPF